MNRSRRGAWLLAAALLAASPASAQQGGPSSRVTLSPPDAARWDAAAYAGWLGAERGDIAEGWDQWSEAASAGGSVGYYFARHLKGEVTLATTSEGRVYSQQQIPIPGQPFPFFRLTDHIFRRTTISGGVVFQAFENTWFHPFVGVGVDAVRERERVEAQTPGVPPRGGTPVVIPPLPESPSISYAARPYGTAGFKWYVSERTFVRSEIRTTLGRGGVDALDWRTGIGVDF
jgi:hypothetical protein